MTEGLLFFAQRVDELLFDFSLDTYKPPALNAPFLCREALDLISEIESGHIEPANLEHVIAELVWSIQNDRVAKELLDADVEYYTLFNDQTPIAVTRLRLEVLASTINSRRYLRELIRQLRLAVERVEKCSIDSLATSLITTLVNDGVSKEWLYVKTHDYFFSPEGEALKNPSDLDGFLHLVDQKVHDFDVYFVVSELIDRVKDSIGAFRIEILDACPTEEVGQLLLTLPLSRNERVVRVRNIRARDPFSARSSALSRLDNLSDLFTLFYHRRQISWRDEVVAEFKCCDFPAFVCPPPRGPMGKAFDLKEERAARELNRMLKSFAARGDRRSFQRFNRVADLHGICVAHDIADNQLVNLWTAIETLVPSRVGASKIKQVVDAVVPFTGLSYLRRIFENLLFDLLGWDKWRTKRLLDKVSIGKGAPFVEKLAVLIVSPECDQLRRELYERLGDFHLLRHRCFALAKELSDSSGVLSRLERHEMKVRWQLRRLYRARNLIVHTSRTPTYISTLIENGHDYLDSIIFEVIRRSSGTYQSRTIEQTFELTAIAYALLKSQLTGAADFQGDQGVILVRKYE